jgi:hypothetical protein
MRNTKLIQKTTTPRRMGTFALAAASVGALLLAAPAQANADEAGTASVAPGGFLRSTAQCPTGKVVIGGGAQVVGAGSGDFRTSLQESAPGTVGGGAQSVWLTALRNNDSVARTVGLFAVCANAPAGYQVVRRDVAVAAGGFLRSTAQCPTGKVVLAGGAQVVGAGSGDFRTSIQESAPGTVGIPSQSVWLTALRNNDSVARTVGLFAVCANSAPTGYQVVRKDVTVAAGGFLRDTALCPVGKVVAGGGAQVVGSGSADFRTRFQETAPGTIGGGAQSLHLTALRNNDSVARTVGLFAVCTNSLAGYQVVRRDV